MAAKIPEIGKLKRALIIRPGAIGDVILTTPFIRALKKANPQLQIDYLAAPGPAKVLQGNPNLNRIIIFDKNELKKGGPFATIINTVLYYASLGKQKYDIVFDLFGNLRTALMSLFTGAKHRIGFTFRVRKYLYSVRVKPDPDPKYNVWYHMDLLKAVNIADDGEKTEFYLRPESEKKAAELYSVFNPGRKPVIGLNPSGTWPTKRWPTENFAALSGMIAERIPDALMLVLWGPGEKEQAEEIIRLSGLQDRISLSPATDLNEMGAVIRGLRMLVTNDGGPKHIASALGIPTITVFGPTNYRSWNESNDEMHAAVVSDESCAPCDKTGCEDYGIRCMKNIKAGTVFREVELMYKKTFQGGKNG